MRHYSIGVFLNIFTPDTDDWIGQIKFIRSLSGVEHVEVLLEYPYLTNQHIEILKKNLSGYRIIIHAPFMDISLLSPHEALAQTSLAILQHAGKVGEKLSAELMTIHAERYPCFWEQAYAEDILMKRLQTLARSISYPVSLENLSLGGAAQIPFPTTPKQIISCSQKLPSNCGMTVDTGHLLKDNFPVNPTIRGVKEKLKNIHLHDGKKGAAHLKLGTGDLSLPDLISLLEDIRYKEFLTIEVVGENEIRDSWQTLRQHIR